MGLSAPGRTVVHGNVTAIFSEKLSTGQYTWMLHGVHPVSGERLMTQMLLSREYPDSDMGRWIEKVARDRWVRRGWRYSPHPVRPAMRTVVAA